MKKPRLLLADDHQLLVDGLRKLLDTEFELVETVSDGRAAVAAYDRLKPDLLLMDIGLPLLNGIDATFQIRRAHPGARVLFVTMQSDRIYVEEAFRAGASGYVLKQGAARELVDAIHTVLRGRIYVSPQLGITLYSGQIGPTGKRSAPFGGKLTARQREVLQLLAEGKTMKEIAAVLEISVRTVEFHRNSISEELGLRTTAELIRYAIDNGLAVYEGVKSANPPVPSPPV